MKSTQRATLAAARQKQDARHSGHHPKTWAIEIVKYAILVVLSVSFILPLYWLITTYRYQTFLHMLPSDYPSEDVQSCTAADILAARRQF